MPLAISFLLAALAIAEPLILCSKVVYAALPTLLKLRTIGELIVTLFAASGTAITNPVVVPAIYQAGNYSIEYLVEEDILNVEGHPEYTDEEVITNLGTGKAFNLDTTGFRNLMETNWQSMRDYQIDAVMRLNEIANTDSVYGAIDNIGGILQDVCKYGYCGFENTIALVSNPLTAVKVSIENIKDSIIDIFGNRIENGFSINTQEMDVLEGWPNIATFMYSPSGNTKMYSRSTEGVLLCVTNEYKDTYRRYIGYINIGEDKGSYMKSNVYSEYQNPLYKGTSLESGEYATFYNYGVNKPEGYYMSFNTRQDMIDYMEGVRSGTIDYEKNVNSNDVIGVNGNINNGTITEGINEGNGIDVISKDEYNNFMEEANDNTENGEYDENAILYDNLINNNEVVAPEEEPEPIIPVQPTDFPVRPTLTPEQTVQSMKGATPGITEFFPFCIPGDIVALFGSLNVEARQAPIITWNWEIERFGIDEEIIIDFSPYDTVASILRNLELILFIIGLAVATRNLIGA